MLNSIELKHNHEMDPEKVKYFRYYQTLPPHTKRTIELNTAVGITMNKTVVIVKYYAATFASFW
ncbi:hypothetical protein RHMOL_Rhmol08G0253100 [Rhododendron molle]|nr:hypothetical protein RHMOL_Rhmol08G0253100 [Rhododendron molle]